MLVIRMQRTGRKGHAQFRVVVQDSRRTPSSGRVVAQLGHFDPHTKEIAINKEKAVYYLKNGAQPSDRVARLLKSEGVKLPDWVKFNSEKKRSVKNPDKLRRNQPKVTPEVDKKTEKSLETVQDSQSSDKPAEETTKDVTEETAEETTEEATKETAKTEDKKSEPAEDPKES